MKKLRLLSFPIAAILLAGCSATPQECDPSQELGFIQKMACTNSGSYQQRIDTKNRELKGELDENYALHTKLQDTKAQQSKVRNQVSSKQQQVSKLDRSISQTKAQTAAKKRSEAAINKDITAINKDITATKQKITKLKSQPKLTANDQQELKRLRAILSQREREAAVAAGL